MHEKQHQAFDEEEKIAVMRINEKLDLTQREF